MKSLLKPLLSAALVALVAGCAFSDPRSASVVAQPKSEPRP